MPPEADPGFGGGPWRIPYNSLPSFCCGTAGLNYGIEYIVGAIGKNKASKIYNLVLVFFSASARNKFKQELYLELEKQFFMEYEIEKNHFLCKFQYQGGPTNQVHMFLEQDNEKFLSDERLRGIERSYTVVHMKNF